MNKTFEQLELPICQLQTVGLSEHLAKTSALPGEEQDLTESEEEALSIERARRFAVKCWQGFGCGNKYKNGYRRGIGATSPNPAKAWAKLPETIQLAAERLKNAQIEHKDALELISDLYGKDTFIYIDPPYLQDTRKKYLYNHEMTDEQHMKLLQIVKESSCKIMLSAYENELYNE